MLLMVIGTQVCWFGLAARMHKVFPRLLWGLFLLWTPGLGFSTRPIPLYRQFIEVPSCEFFAPTPIRCDATASLSQNPFSAVKCVYFVWFEPDQEIDSRAGHTTFLQIANLRFAG